MDLLSNHDATGPATDDASVDAAWRTHAPTALRFATALVGPADAHDVVVNAFLRVVRQPEWRDIDRLDRYLIRSVRNEAQNLYRQRRRRWARDLAAVRPESSSDTTPDIDLLRAISRLSVQQRAVVFLAYWHDLTLADIADTLGISRSTAHRHLTRAQAQLRKALS